MERIRAAAFPESGRSSVCFQEIMTGCLRPEAVSRQSNPESLIRSTKDMIGLPGPDHADWKL